MNQFQVLLLSVFIIGAGVYLLVDSETLRLDTLKSNVDNPQIDITNEEARNVINKPQDNFESGEVDGEAYKFFLFKDSPGNDLTQLEGKTVIELKESCTNSEHCRAFNSNGWLKNKVSPVDNWVGFKRGDEKVGLFVKSEFAPSVSGS